jgi:transposase-like protein
MTMPELIPMTTRKKCPRPKCGSEDVHEIGSEDASHASHPKEDSPVEKGLWLCNKCKKAFQLRDGYA